MFCKKESIMVCKSSCCFLSFFFIGILICFISSKVLTLRTFSFHQACSSCILSLLSKTFRFLRIYFCLIFILLFVIIMPILLLPSFDLVDCVFQSVLGHLGTPLDFLGFLFSLHYLRYIVSVLALHLSSYFGKT